jgi:hypothetical protein
VSRCDLPIRSPLHRNSLRALAGQAVVLSHLSTRAPMASEEHLGITSGESSVGGSQLGWSATCGIDMTNEPATPHTSGSWRNSHEVRIGLQRIPRHERTAPSRRRVPHSEWKRVGHLGG